MSRPARTFVELVRHGEPDGGERFRGTRDDPLSATGWTQLETACAGGRWDVVVSSPLRRCHDFARELCARAGLALEVMDDLREIGFGAWEGLTSAEVIAQYGEALRAFWRDPVSCPPPGGEPLADFAARVERAWTALLTRHSGRRVLVVAHGGSIRMIVRTALDVPLANVFRFRLPYAAVTEVEVQHHPDHVLPVLVRLGAASVRGAPGPGPD